MNPGTLRAVIARRTRPFPRCALAAALIAIFAVACSSKSAPPSSASIAVAPTALASPAVTIESAATVEPPTPVPGTPQPPRCPDPNVTPIASRATVIPDGSTPSSGTPTPIRIAHAFDVPPLPSATHAAAPAPTRPAPHDDAALDRLIRDRLGADAPHYAVVIEDLRDGRRVEIDPDRVFYAASLFKIEVMYELFRQRNAGVLDFNEQYIASDYYASFGLGPRRIDDCQQATVTDLLAAMMSVSDNVAAVMLQDRAGAQNINDAMAALGLTQTRLTEDGSLPATAADMARLVEAIARGDAVSRDASTQMAALMATEEIDDRIPRHLPAGTLVEHKTANWDDATHDAGIVHGTKGTYVMVLMSDIGFGGDAAAVESSIAKIAFDHFEQ